MFPLSIQGSVPTRRLELLDIAGARKAICEELARQRISYRLNGDNVTFVNWLGLTWPLWRHSAADHGQFEFHRDRISYWLSTKLITTITTLITVLAASILLNAKNLSLVEGISLTVLVWVYFTGGSYIFTWIRNRRFLRTVVNRHVLSPT